jgi:hypothetical protein
MPWLFTSQYLVRKLAVAVSGDGLDDRVACLPRHSAYLHSLRYKFADIAAGRVVSADAIEAEMRSMYGA